jgi:hypothetical protein
MSTKKATVGGTKPTVSSPKLRDTPTPPAPVPPAESTQGSLDEIAARVKEQEAALSPARRAAQELREREALETASAVTVEQALRSIGDLKLTVDSTIDQVGQLLVEQAKKLTAVQESVGIKARELSRLYDLEIAADTLATLIGDHEQRKAQFEQDAAARKSQFERETQESRAAWEKETVRIKEELATERARASKEWQREEEEYEYALKTKRSREQEEYTKRKQALEAQLTDARARQEKELAERDAALAVREKDLVDLRARVAAVPGELDRAVAQAREEATKVAEDRARHEAALQTKDAEATEKLLGQRIETLELMLKEKDSRIEQIQAEIRDASVKVREIAVKAIEGASGASALTRVSEIAMQQAKGSGDRG